MAVFIVFLIILIVIGFVYPILNLIFKWEK